jgi:hypothetical protein
MVQAAGESLRRSQRRGDRLCQRDFGVPRNRTGSSLGATRVFEHEWHIASRPELPGGEPEAVVRWELMSEGDSNTLLTNIFSRLTKRTALLFAPGQHAYLGIDKPLYDYEKIIFDSLVRPSFMNRQIKQKTELPKTNKLEWRRSKVIEIRSRGLSQNRNMSYLRKW